MFPAQGRERITAALKMPVRVWQFRTCQLPETAIFKPGAQFSVFHRPRKHSAGMNAAVRDHGHYGPRNHPSAPHNTRSGKIINCGCGKCQPGHAVLKIHIRPLFFCCSFSLVQAKETGSPVQTKYKTLSRAVRSKTGVQAAA
jgi:hypothetical protein